MAAAITAFVVAVASIGYDKANKIKTPILSTAASLLTTLVATTVISLAWVFIGWK